MSLENVSVKEWNEVAEYYCKAKAKIETRMIRYEDEKKDVILFLNYPFNFHKFTAETWEPRKNGKVHALCGSLEWEDDGQVQQHADIILEWVPDQFLWEAYIGSSDSLSALQVLCGNVIGYTLGVMDVLNEKRPRFFQWNRPDAPKDNKRQWLMS